MAPVDSQLAVMPASAVAPPGPGAGTIPLSTLIDYILQRTYHELTVLSELLPRKTDMERKIEIVQFASRTRQLFVRLLALVKWANSASKVDKCAAISSFLDEQAMLFVDTADMLAKMARETLVHARLPSFSIPCAVDVLITGTYPRLPACIRDRIVPADPITPQEKRQTLMRLNQIIEHRLVTNPLPPQMRRLRIENGRVKFHVEYEFEVTLTLMGEGAAVPWRLLDIEILVKDHETGDGKSLVHSLQVNYIHQLVQSRLLDNDKPLFDLYNCLHSFCQSLQLEVLHSQTQRLVHQRLGEHIRVEEYSAGKSLAVAYWRDPSRRETSRNELSVFRLSIHVDENNPAKPLQISHTPQIQGSDSIKVSQAIRSDQLSIEKLIIHTIHVRSQARLKEIERELRKYVSGSCELRDLPIVLYVPVLSPCMDSEKLCVTIDIYTGDILTSINYKTSPITTDIEECLRGERKDLSKLLTKLRLHLALRRCEKSVQHLPVTCYHDLPLVNLAGHPVEKLGQFKLYIKLAKQANCYLVVEAHCSDSCSVVYRYHVLHVTPSSADTTPEDVTEETPQPYLTAGHITEIQPFAMTHGPGSKIHDIEEEELSPVGRKRKLLLGDPQEPPTKQKKFAPYFVPELTNIIALCEDRISFMSLAAELTRRRIPHENIQVDGDCTCLSLGVLRMPECNDISDEVLSQLQEVFLACNIRQQKKGSRLWLIEYMFTNTTLPSTNLKEQGPIQRVSFVYEVTGQEVIEKVTDEMLQDWVALCRLYSVVIDFSQALEDSRSVLYNMVEVKSYNYKRLILGYGPSKSHTVSVQWKASDSQFHLAFATCGQSGFSNNHTLVGTQLERHFNEHSSLAKLVQLLHETWSPVAAISKLNSSPLLGLMTRPNQPVPTWAVLPQSPTHIRLAFRNYYCIDIHCRGDNVVAVRDGAYSLFDTSKVVEGFTPTPGLKAFLNMYVDDSVVSSHSRRRSVTEDDNPPSPVGMDTMDSFMSGHHSTGSPAGGARPQKQDGLRFHSPMTPPSNPHTPASPSAAGRMSQQQYASSPAAAGFPLASPPPLQPGVAPSPSTALISIPSPGNILTGGSPNPALPVPSPGSFGPAPSPSSLGIHMPSPAAAFISPQGMVEGGSPYPSTQLANPSPGTRNWPASPSMPGPSPASRHGTVHSPGHLALHSPQMGEHAKTVMSPSSRMLPQRSWAASIPTLLSHEALNKLLTPSALPGQNPSTNMVPCCPLERFLSCVFLRRHLQRLVQSEENLHQMQSSEPGLILFKVDSLHFRVSLNPNTLQSLHLKGSPMSDHMDQWTADELQLLEHFFEMKVASPPHKANTLTAFGRLLGAPARVLKDCVQIMRLELVPERNMKWSVQWCLTIPPEATSIAPAGTAAVVINKGKMIFMLQLTRIGVPVPANGEPQTVVVPVLYNMTTNLTTVVSHPSSQSAPSQATVAIQNMFKRFADFNPKPSDCSIYPAVRELLSNLVIPL